MTRLSSEDVAQASDSLMPKPFEHLAKLFTEVVDEFAKFQDKQASKELLLMRMTLILSEARQLGFAHLKGHPPVLRQK